MTKRNSFVATNAFSGLKISHTCRAFAAGVCCPRPKWWSSDTGSQRSPRPSSWFRGRKGEEREGTRGEGEE